MVLESSPVVSALFSKRCGEVLCVGNVRVHNELSNGVVHTVLWYLQCIMSQIVGKMHARKHNA